MKPCACGSGLYRRDLIDARGIFAGFVCDDCEAAKRRQYRVEVFDDPNYEHDEPIDEENWSGSPCPIDPDNYWIDDRTGERVNANTGERTRSTGIKP